MAVEPEVTRGDVVLLNDKIRALEERLNENSVESKTDQEAHCLDYCLKNVTGMSGEMEKLQGIVQALEKAKTAAEEARSGLFAAQAASQTGGATPLTKNEPVMVSKLSLVSFYGVGLCWINIRPANGDPYELATTVSHANSMMGSMALVHPSDTVKLCGLEPIGFIVPLN